jgi:hypothetical protein
MPASVPSSPVVGFTISMISMLAFCGQYTCWGTADKWTELVRSLAGRLFSAVRTDLWSDSITVGTPPPPVRSPVFYAFARKSRQIFEFKVLRSESIPLLERAKASRRGRPFSLLLYCSKLEGWMSHEEQKYMRRVLRGLETNRDLEGVDRQ